MKTRVQKYFNFRAALGLVVLLALAWGVSCGDSTSLGLSRQDDIPPKAPVVKAVNNTNGAAVIYYSVPEDDDLLGVKATYIINNKEYEAMASPYKDSIRVEGFGDAGEYDVFLKSIDKSKNESESVLVKINPLESAVKTIFRTLDVISSFGGIKLSWENQNEQNIIVEVSLLDSIGDWNNMESFYTSSKIGSASIRGLDTLDYNFRVNIRDRWDNYSDFYETVQKPLFEEELNKSKFREITPLPGDAPAHPSLPVRNIWDGNTVANCFHTAGTSGIGDYVTFDMGQVAKLSRFKMWQRTESQVWIYSHNNLKHYVLYGCEEITAEMRESGSLEGWDYIYEAHTHKPSGDGPVTNEDRDYILNGDEHEVPLEAPKVRYIRIHMLENWSGGTIAQIGEMSFWGQVDKN